MITKGEMVGIFLLLIFISFSFSAKFSGYNILENIDDEGVVVLYENFKNINYETTNFIYLDDNKLKNISNMVLENDFGKIEFLEEINLLEGVERNLIDMDSIVSIEQNRVKVNVLSSPQLNKKAIITLNNLSFTNPRIIKNGYVCADVCRILEYNSGVLVFEVNSLGVFSVEEAIGGVSISGQAIYLLPTLILDKDFVEVSMEKGYEEMKILKISNVGNSPLNLTLKSTLKNVEVPNNLEIDIGETKEVNLSFLSEANIPDVYFGKILIKGDGIDESVHVIFEIKEEGAIEEIETKILSNGIGVGENVEIELRISSENLVSNNIEIEYIIKNFDGEIVFWEKESVPSSKEIQLMKELKLSSEILPGNYLFYVKIFDGELVSFSTEILKIVNKGELRTFFVIFLAGLFIILIFFVLFLERFRKRDEDAIFEDVKEELKDNLRKELNKKEMSK